MYTARDIRWLYRLEVRRRGCPVYARARAVPDVPAAPAPKRRYYGNEAHRQRMLERAEARHVRWKRERARKGGLAKAAKARAASA